MPVDIPHPEYTQWAPLWQKARDVTEGEYVIKGKMKGKNGDARLYLPQLPGMQDIDYAGYLHGARFYNVMGGTIRWLLGAAFRVPPVVEVPAKMAEWLPDITLSGVPFESLLKKDVEDKLQTGRYGFRVDMMENGGRPYIAYYSAENIWNWREAIVDGHRVLTMIVLREHELQPGIDEFEVKEKEVYHVLDLVEGKCRVRKFRQVGNTRVFDIELMPPPRRMGQVLNFIPFVPDGVSDTTPSCEKLPLLDLISVNLGHYCVTADYYDAIRFTSKPQPWIAGINDDQTELRIGSRYAWPLPVGAVPGYLEYHGTGIPDIRQALIDDESRMARLGAAVIEEPKEGVESAETSRINQSGKTSMLASITNTTGQAATIALRMMAWWAGLAKSLDDQNIKCTMNQDFVEARMSPQDLLALVHSWQARGISRDTLIYNIKRGGLLPEGRTVKDEIGMIDSEPPPMPEGEPENLDEQNQQKEAA